MQNDEPKAINDGGKANAAPAAAQPAVPSAQQDEMM
jgi:hypothetical protein